MAKIFLGSLDQMGEWLSHFRVLKVGGLIVACKSPYEGWTQERRHLGN